MAWKFKILFKYTRKKALHAVKWTIGIMVSQAVSQSVSQSVEWRVECPMDEQIQSGFKQDYETDRNTHKHYHLRGKLDKEHYLLRTPWVLNDFNVEAKRLASTFFSVFIFCIHILANSLFVNEETIPASSKN